MARSKTSISTRLKKLRLAKQRVFDLPRGLVLASVPMAKVLGVTWPTLRDWTNEIDGFEQSGAFERGAQGMEYEFCPVRTLWFLIEHFEQISSDQADKNRGLRQSTGVDLPDDEDDVTFEEARGLVNMTVTMTAAKREQGEYTPTHEWSAFLEGYNQRVVNGILGVSTKVDPNGALPPRTREQMDSELRNLAADVHRAAGKFIEENRAGIQQGGTRGTGAPARQR